MHPGRLLCCLLIAFTPLVGCATHRQPVSRPAETQVTASNTARAGARQQAAFPVPIIEVEGDPATLGRSYARQLRAPIVELLDGYLHRWFRSDMERFVAYTAAQGFAKHMSSEHLAELTTAAETAGISLGDALLAQCFLDLTPMTACSSISLPADAFEDGVPRLARNLDFPSMNIADRHSIVVIFRPAGRNQFAAVTWPGLLGVLSGMNEHGLVLVNMEVTRERRLPAAMPYIYLYRTVLEQCATVEEAVELLRTTPRQSANNILLMDAHGGRAAVEITPEGIVVRRAEADQPVISTNHHRGTDLATPGQCQRYDRLVSDARQTFGQADVGTLQSMLRNVQQGQFTLQSMVFEPTNRVLYLSVGERSAEKQMHRLDLRPYFRERD